MVTAPPSAVAAATDLLTAITAAGGTVSPALTVAPAPGGRAALSATSAVGASRSVLLQLPLDALLTPASAAALLPPHAADSPLLDDYALLSLGLITARAVPGTGGPVLAAYVAGLPDADALDVPLLWGEGELKGLTGSVLGTAAGRMKAEVASEFAAIAAEVFDADRESWPASVYTPEAYAWSAAVVVERGLCLPGYPLVLAPGVDLATAAAALGRPGEGAAGIVDDGGGGGGGVAPPGAVDIVGTGLFGRTKVVQLSSPAGGIPAGATVTGVTAEAEADGRTFRDLFLEAGVVAVPSPAARGVAPAAEDGVVGLSFGLSPEDGQYDDKVDILETYAYPGEAGGDEEEDEDGERRVFPLAAAPAGEEEEDDEDADADWSSRAAWTPPPDLMPFLRLAALSGGDVFLLEAVFRPEVWGFMAAPVSEDNEAAAIDAILSSAADALSRYDAPPQEGGAGEEGGGADGGSSSSTTTTARRAALARRLVGVETAALRACVAYFTRERETLDSKEYYQERRLRELNLLRPVDPSEIVDSEAGGRAAAAFDEYY